MGDESTESRAKELRFKALEFVRKAGPALPVQVSKEIGRDSFFAGAILSDLVDGKQVLVSHAKIGGSPVYYVRGQEQKLEVLFNYMPMKEKEAFSLLKTKKVLRDREQEPSIRVALRSLKDFAVPLEVGVGGIVEIFWKWHLTDNQEAESFIKENYLEMPVHKQELQKELPKEEKKARQRRTFVVDNFLKSVEEFISKKGIEVLSRESIKKNKQAEFVVRFNSDVGKIVYYLVAKNKNKITEADITVAYNKAHSKRMPLFFLSNGDIAKKSRDYLEREMKGIIFAKL